jgi:hypothetical protein
MAYPFRGLDRRTWDCTHPKDTPSSFFCQSTTSDYISNVIDKSDYCSLAQIADRHTHHETISAEVTVGGGLIRVFIISIILPAVFDECGLIQTNNRG